MVKDNTPGSILKSFVNAAEHSARPHALAPQSIPALCMQTWHHPPPFLFSPGITLKSHFHIRTRHERSHFHSGPIRRVGTSSVIPRLVFPDILVLGADSSSSQPTFPFSLEPAVLLNLHYDIKLIWNHDDFTAIKEQMELIELAKQQIF